MPRLIGLAGKSGVGKDEVGRILHERHGFQRYAFATPIKRALEAMLCVAPQQWDDRAWKERPLPWLGVSPRRLAQTLGTEWARHTIREDFWLRAADWWCGIADGTLRFDLVITDVRFANECEWIRDRGGVLWHVQRPGVAPVEAHASELAVPDDPERDYYLDNAGSLAMLADMVRATLTLMEVEKA